MTKARLEFGYRLLLVLLALGLFWSIWASAQAPTPDAAPAGADAAVSTNSAASTNAAVTIRADHLNVPLEATNALLHVTFGLDEIPFLRDHRVMGIALWQYVASFLFIFLAFAATKVLDYATQILLTRWAQKTPNRIDDQLIEAARGPVRIVAFVILLNIGLGVFDWPANVARWLSNGLKILVAVTVTYSLLKVVDIALGAWHKRHTLRTDKTFDQQLVPIIRNALKVLVVVVATLVTLDNVGVNITSLIASLSIGGLVLGLAAQDTVANLFGAVSVLVDQPFKVGDSIKFEGTEGVVETISLRSTRIRNADGHLITVPNKTMGNATVTNVSQRPNIRTSMNFGLTYDTSAAMVSRAAQLLETILRAHPNTLDVWVAFNKFTDSSLNLSVTHWWNNTDYKAYLAGMQELNLEIKQRFEEEEINFAYPTQTLYLKQQSESWTRRDTVE